MAFISRAYFVWFLSACITQVTGWWGTLTGLYSSSYINNLISIHNSHGLIMLFVDYECSGIIETLAYLSLLWSEDGKNKVNFHWNSLDFHG